MKVLLVNGSPHEKGCTLNTLHYHIGFKQKTTNIYKEKLKTQI